MIKFKKLGLTTLGTLAIATPIAAVVSCGGYGNTIPRNIGVKVTKSEGFSGAFKLSDTNAKDNDLIKGGKIRSWTEIEKQKQSFDKHITLNLTLSDSLKTKVISMLKPQDPSSGYGGYDLEIHISLDKFIDGAFFQNDINSKEDAAKISKQIIELLKHNKTKINFNLELPDWLKQLKGVKMNITASEENGFAVSPPAKIESIKSDGINLTWLLIRNLNLVAFDTSKLPSTLKTLDLNENLLQIFDPSKLPSGLETLFLYDNQLSMFDATKLPSGLKWLNVSRNQLRTFDTSKLPSSLETLELDNNRINKFTAIKLPPNLKTINLKNNELSTFYLDDLPKGLKTLRLSGNPLTPATAKQVMDWKVSHDVE